MIGGGSGGLAVAAGAAQLGASVILIERGEMGGDCLNFGCVPSKSLIASARLAASWRRGPALGIDYQPPRLDLGAITDSVSQVIAAIAPNDSVERFERLGVTVMRGRGALYRPAHVKRKRIRNPAAAVRHCNRIPSGGTADPGSRSAPYLTNETIFSNRVLPEHLIVVGGGPIGIGNGPSLSPVWRSGDSARSRPAVAAR